MMEEITAEYAVSELAESVELLVTPKVTVACKTDLGRVRENNEDKFEYFIPEDERTVASRGLVFLMCDGMGGHAAGQIASELTCKTFIDVYLHHPSSHPEEAAKAAVAASNRFVLDVGRAVPSRRGMGTTLSALVLLQDRAMVVHVGDSRIYRLRGDVCEQLTVDHTWVEEVVRAGLMPREDAEVHANRHMVMRAIGVEGDDFARPDVLWFDLQEGDTFMLCSDGLSNHVSNQQIGDFLATNSPAEATWKLVTSALADGGSDNCTVLVVRIDALLRSAS
jgi:protein phosphatase